MTTTEDGMTAPDLSELKRLAEWRGAGKWEQYDHKEIVLRSEKRTDLLHAGATFYDALDCKLAVEAVNALPSLIEAAERLEKADAWLLRIGDAFDGGNAGSMEECVTRAEAAAEKLVEVERERDALRADWAEEREVIFSDLRNLLDELGMFSGARPESPHEVMCAAIEEVHRLKERVR